MNLYWIESVTMLNLSSLNFLTTLKTEKKGRILGFEFLFKLLMIVRHRQMLYIAIKVPVRPNPALRKNLTHVILIFTCNGQQQENFYFGFFLHPHRKKSFPSF